MASSFYKRFINAAVAVDAAAAVEETLSSCPGAVNDAGPSGLTALMWAARANDSKLIRALLRYGASTESLDDSGSSALVWAARSGAECGIDELLRGGAAVDVPDAFGWTALIWAVIGGQAGAVALLLNAGAQLSCWHGCRCAPLPACARDGRADLVQALLSSGCDVNQADSGGSTALACATYGGHSHIVRLLLQWPSINVDSCDSNGDTPLLLAAFAGRTELAAALLRSGADVNHRDADGCTALCWACRAGNVEMVDTVLRWRPDVTAKDRWGRTALSWAAEDGYADVVSRLAERSDCDPYTRDGLGNTAFHLAADAPTLFHLLRVSGLHPRPRDLVNSDGEDWTSLAEKRGALSAECVAALEEATSEYYVSPRRVGRALIVSVDSSTDVAAEVDFTKENCTARLMRRALELLGYRVDVSRNPTALQMDECVSRFARKSDGHGSTVFVCFLTPTDEFREALLGSDGGQLPVSRVIATFKKDACNPVLRGRPKVIVFHGTEKVSAPLPAAPRPRGLSEPLDWHLLITFSAQPPRGHSPQDSYPARLASEIISSYGEFEIQQLLTKVKAGLAERDSRGALAVETKSTLDKLLVLCKVDNEPDAPMDVVEV